MCGIAGLLNLSGDLAPEDLKRLGESMAQCMQHRGPDDKGVWIDHGNFCCLAHRRLSIIDTSKAGHQPMESPDGRFCISYNGEIYNYRELKPAVEAKGHTFRTKTDTEVLIETLRMSGPDALLKLDGMYAFALFDTQKQELLLGRDPFGEKPLYYISTPKYFAFASELHALQQLPFFDDSVDMEAVAEYLSFQYIGAPRTLYQCAKKLQPGHFLVVKPDGTQSIRRYYEFKPERIGSDPRSLDDLADELEEILLRSTRRRLISDVPLGAFLSGGVDSSTVCALVRKVMGLPLKTFSIGFSDSPDSEHETAREFSRLLSTEHYDEILEPNASSFLLGVGNILDEPNGDSSCLPTYLLSEFTRKHVTVAISGDGGDELFGGYDRYFATLQEEEQASAGRLENWRPGSAYFSDRILFFAERDICRLLGYVPAGLKNILRDLRMRIDLRMPSLLGAMRKADVDNYMPGAVLPKVDRMSMQHSLEVRTPYLNLEVAGFCERLPDNAMYKDNTGKLVLKRLALRYLPAELINTKKRGFGLPMSGGWGQNELLRVARSLLNDPNTRMRDFAGRNALTDFLREQRDPRKFGVYRVWSLCVLESYLRQRKTRACPAPTPIEISSNTDLAVTTLHAVVPPPPVLEDQRPVFLFCQDSVPAWWKILPPGSVLVSAQKYVSTPELPALHVNWLDRDHSGIRFLQQEPSTRGATAVICAHTGDRRISSLFSMIARTRFAQVFASDGYYWQKLPGPWLAERLFAASICFWIRSLRGILRYPVRALADICVGLLQLPRNMGWPILFSRQYSFRVDKEQQIKPFGGSAYAFDPPGKQQREHQFQQKFGLFEDKKELSWQETPSGGMGQLGRGRATLQDGSVVFKTSDNSDPRTNALSYRLIRKNLGAGRLLDALTGSQTSGQTFPDKLEKAIINDNANQGDSPVPVGRTDKIVLVTHGLLPGGAERQWCYMARGLKKSGYEVDMLLTDGARNPASGYYLRLLEQVGVEPLSADRLPRRPDYHSIAQGLPHADRSLFSGIPANLKPEIYRVFLWLRELRPHAVLCQLDRPNILAGLAAWLAGVPRILLSTRNVNPSHFPYLFEPWYRDYYLLLQQSKRVILSGNSKVGNDDYASWLGIPAERFTLISNVLDTDSMNETVSSDLSGLRKELRLTEDTPTICGAFRLSEEKQPFLFLDVVEKVLEQIPSLRVLLAGIGPLQDRIEESIKDRKLKNTVHLLGRRDDLGEIMRVSQILLLTSRQEGTPNVILESQYLQTPVVATKVGGVAEIVEEGVTGFLCSPDTPDELAHYCVRLLREHDERKAMGAAGKKVVKEKHSMDRLVLATLEALGSAQTTGTGRSEVAPSAM